MKKAAIIMILLIVASAFLYAEGRDETTNYRGNGRGADQQYGRGMGRRVDYGRNGDERFAEQLSDLLIDVEGGELSQEEIEGLNLLREEEKLARDVYAALYTVWNFPVFQNIGESEQQHMDALKILFDKYRIADPVEEDVEGIFESKELTELYASLVDRGKTSIVDALQVGAAIEDLDIADLQQALGHADNDDIRIVYQNLMKGSRNHLRSFIRLLSRENKTYGAQYITADYLEKILSINREFEPISDPDYSI